MQIIFHLLSHELQVLRIRQGEPVILAKSDPKSANQWIDLFSWVHIKSFSMCSNTFQSLHKTFCDNISFFNVQNCSLWTVDYILDYLFQTHFPIVNQVFFILFIEHNALEICPSNRYLDKFIISIAFESNQKSVTLFLPYSSINLQSLINDGVEENHVNSGRHIPTVIIC